MKRLLLLFILPFFGTCLVQGQIYYKKTVYLFDYTISQPDGTTESGTLYLGCLGKVWAMKSHPQAAVLWTTDPKHLNEELSTTGIYEEEECIWLHPPRQDAFSILEYSPWPHICFPVQENPGWNKEFIPGPNWINEKYNIGRNTKLSFTYKNKGSVVQRLKFLNKEVTCWQIDAVSVKSEYPSSFSGLFNAEYGFIRMEFRNVDHSLITLELSQVESWKAFQSEKNKTSSTWDWGN